MGAKQKRKEDKYILEDLCFCDLTNNTCREGAGKTKQDLEMSHLSGSWTTGDNGTGNKEGLRLALSTSK